MKLLFVAILSFSSIALARKEMSGIKFADYDGFTEKWKLVTVRYRTDTGEQRFTYANPAAWDALQKDSKDYPDGAVFAKIGAGTEDDPAFPSSKVPSGSKRFQFMVRDKKKYASTGGWGYALFNSNGETFNEKEKTAVDACYACHRIVPGRGEVFSQPMSFGLTKASAPADEAWKMDFKTLAREAWPADLKTEAPEEFKSLLSLQGPLRKSLFQGTIDEVRPLLAATAKKFHQPAALISNDGKRYSVVFPAAPGKVCPAKSTAMLALYTIASQGPAVPKTARLEFCVD